jgi:hypothetical protein
MRNALLMLSLIPFLLSGCQQGNMADAVANGVVELDVAKDFEALFPDAEHFISYYTGTKGDPTWNSTVGLHGRYVLTVQFGIGFDASRTHPAMEGVPVFHLVELANIRENGYGYTDRQMEFGLKEWNLLLESSGDFEVIGYPMTKGDPLDGFDKVWR